MGKITIKQVASAAGVSVATVSRVMNGRPDVSMRTRLHVRQYIDRMGYAPNAVARSLIQGRSNILGVVSTGIGYYGPSQTLAGIEVRSNELGYSLMLSLLHDPERNTGQQVLEQLVSQQVDGILWAVPEVGRNRDWICEEVPRIAAPVVFLSMACQAELSLVTIDNYAGARLAVEHLIGLGYRRIGHVAAPDVWWEASQRERGWRDALRDANLGPHTRWLARGDWSSASGLRAMQQLFEQAPDIEAVFASNDQMALGVLKAAALAGRDVPRDLAVVGFDDIPEAAYFSPSLSTVRHDLASLGAQAVSLLDRQITARREKDSAPPDQITLKPSLVIRESCGNRL